MKEILKNAIKSSMNYTEYNLLFEHLVTEKQTTGDPSEEKIKYTKLNFSRSKRLDKRATIAEPFQQQFKDICENQTWLIITEPWCGDAAQTLPFLNKIAQLSKNIKLKIVLRDDHPELMDQFLTNGSKSIPKLIILNDQYEVLDHWGPRSQAATKLVTDFKAQHGQLNDAFKEQLQIWYNKDKGVSIVNELSEIVKKRCSENASI